ncbi:unnamed protein product [Rhizoctonia solani]|uniref:Mitochondrial inner membrane protease ATP23 n=1 Tax=Rhizoctonia solani TaxID=456999 RepID=A0A8H3GA14_9AGAM|nr:unnamed protein product [Rhizoctonia solani]
MDTSSLATRFGSFRSASEASAFERWRASLVQFTGLGLSEEEQSKRDQVKGLEREEAQWRRCEAWKNDLMKNSPVVVFMLKHLALHRTNLTSAHVHCAPCDPTRAGGFSPDAGILLCQDRFMSKSHMQDTLVHEMVHVYDHARFKVDWSDLRHHACSEVGGFVHLDESGVDRVDSGGEFEWGLSVVERDAEGVYDVFKATSGVCSASGDPFGDGQPGV